MLVNLRQLRTFLVLSAMAGMVGVSCAQNDDPFEVGRLKEYRDGATPTSAAVQSILTATPTALPGDAPSIQKVETDTPSEAIRIVTWEDNRSGSDEVYAAVSTDGGVTWSESQLGTGGTYPISRAGLNHIGVG